MGSSGSSSLKSHVVASFTGSEVSFEPRVNASTDQAVHLSVHFLGPWRTPDHHKVVHKRFL